MFPRRQLLYHRGVDDHSGTYITDYAFSAVCFILCTQLTVRIRRERQFGRRDNTVTSTCYKAINIFPWNWPKERPTAVTMSTYGILMLGISNCVMALFGGLTHQYLQTVEPYNDVGDLWSWLIIWRVAASFSAWLCLGLLIMAEQLIIQEGVIWIPRWIRIIYYVISICACLVLFCYNYAPLAGNNDDPFSVGKTFMVSFVVMFVYGLTTIAVLIRNCCCDERPYFSDNDVQYSPAYSIESKRTERTPYRREIYSCCKTVAVHWTNNSDDISSRRIELLLTLIAPWIFLAAGVTNQLLKKKCADSDHAFEELGCPLPDLFNHNAVMHVIQIVSVIVFFIAENLSITRRKNLESSRIKRVATSSTIYNDVINSCTVPMAETTALEKMENFTQTEYTNNNKPCGRDDVTCEIGSGDPHTGSDVASTSSGNETPPEEPKFPTSLNFGEGVHRDSLYDNLSVS